jgi:hypothetical protein
MLHVFATPALALAYRVICGKFDTPYTDMHGYTWSTDQAYAPGAWGYTSTRGVAQLFNSIENTYDGPLYQQERLNGNYRFDVPAGTYFIKLLFAENYWGTTSGNHDPYDRIFNVTVNGQPVISNFSILQAAGGRANRAMVKSCEITVAGSGSYANCLVVETSASKDQSKFSAIEISDTPTLTDAIEDYDQVSPVDEELFRINCGGIKTRDVDGTLWMADESFAFCQRWGFQNGVAGTVVKAWNTPDEARLNTWREGGTDFQYLLAVPNGSYQVKLFFAEHTYASPGQRVFDVSVNGASVASNLDIVNQVGTAAALTLTAQASVSNERLAITFPRITAGQAMLSALEVKAVAVSDAAFLDFVERRGIDFFTQTAAPFCTVNPVNGLIQDRAHNFVASPYWISNGSLAAVGFGAAALAVGQSRGWISSTQAGQQASATLNYFCQALPYTNDSQNYLTHQSGFFFHFLDMATGKRISGSELSSVDTSLFFAGMLVGWNLFGSAFRDQVDQLMDRADWMWFTRGDARGFVSDAWTPESGFSVYSWSGYNEDVLLDMIGMGARQHTLSPACWFNMTRVWFGSGSDSTMIEVKDAPTPLFTHIYPQCFLDLRQTQDDKNNYFLNTRRAIRLDQAFCQGHAERPTYAAGAWGLTSGDSPRSGLTYYNYRTIDWAQDGTVNPAMVGAAVPFAPEIAVPTLRRMFFRYKHFLWGRFGFANTYNLCAPKTLTFDPSWRGWVSPDVIGIDLGAMILGIENYRTGMVWKNILEYPGVRKALTQAGFGLNIIDDFDTDHSLNDAAQVRDGQWTVSNPQVYSLEDAANIQGNGSSCLGVKCLGNPTSAQDSIQITQLSQPANISYFCENTILSFKACGAQGFRLRFRDNQGKESATSEPEALTIRGDGPWKTYTWDYSGLDWQECDARNIDAILLFPVSVPGSEFYLDTLALGTSQPDPPVPTPAPVTLKFAVPLVIYPNPATTEARFAFAAMDKASQVTMDIYNLAGECIARIREDASAGQPFEVVWQRGATAPGIYFGRIQVRDSNHSILFKQTRKIALL